MRHRVAGRKLNRNSAQRKALLRGLATELFRHGRIQTTEAKAKSLRPVAEKLITLAKRGDLHARRQAAAQLYDPAVLQTLFDEIAEAYQDRPGGYTRIYKLGPRKGDGAQTALIELVDYEAEVLA
jgi:large subunit ribosomal protein L17